MKNAVLLIVGITIGFSIGWAMPCCLDTPISLLEMEIDGNFQHMQENRSERETYSGLVQDLLEQGYGPNEHPVWVYLDEIRNLDEVYEHLREYQEEFNLRLDELRQAEPYCCES